jgi:hypothetical protein
MELDRMKVSLQTVKDTIAIMENVEQPDDAGYYLQLEHEKFVAECIEKQIPKKPLYIAGDYDMPICPDCKQLVDDTELCCSSCGQALDWSDTE